MTTPSKHTPAPGRSGGHSPPPPGSEEKEQRRNTPQAQSRDEDRDAPDQVEIGDPVPEDDRTIKAGRRADETGEDEDLPTDDRRRGTGEAENLPDDDGGIEAPREPH